jgi:predicted nucleic acid-binding protein
VAAYFVDSSALVKRYVQEVGTSWVRTLTHRGTAHEIYLARITAVEVTAAVARRRRARTLSAPQASSILSRFRNHLADRYIVLEMPPALLTEAMKLANAHELRAYDAVQLAAAIALKKQWLDAGIAVVLVSADQELNAAASAEGLAVDDPTAHP